MATSPRRRARIWGSGADIAAGMTGVVFSLLLGLVALACAVLVRAP
ncbi:MAG: hypothetical protein U0263_12575 [Polyangiaceae bacterium]